MFQDNFKIGDKVKFRKDGTHLSNKCNETKDVFIIIEDRLVADRILVWEIKTIQSNETEHLGKRYLVNPLQIEKAQ